MSNTPPDNAVEQRRKVLKGALAASGVVTMGYSGSALASFQCVTSTPAENLPGFKTSITSGSNWAWLTVQVYNTVTSDTSNVWKAVKVPTGSDPSPLVTGGDEYFFLDSSNPVLALPGESVPLTLTESVNVPTDISVGSEDGSRVAFVIIYFETDGSIAGFHPTYVPTSSSYPAQGSCLTSLNPDLDRMNISFGG